MLEHGGAGGGGKLTRARKIQLETSKLCRLVRRERRESRGKCCSGDFCRQAERRRVDENWSEKNSAKLGKNKRRIDCTVLEIIRKKRKIYIISSKIVQQRRCSIELEYWNSITIRNNSGNNLRDRASAEARKQRDNEICVPRRYRYIVQERDSIFSVSILSRNK